jgi:RimJ/RimL family protein N-acetyltransferase
MKLPSEAAFEPVEIHTRTGSALQVREYASDDLPPLVEMYKGFEPKRIAQGLPPPDVPRIAQWLDRLQQKSRALLAWDASRVVAHAILCPISKAAVEFTVFVHQDYRRAGLGTAMTRLAVAFAERCGFAEVFLTTELSNLAALRVYRRVGFQRTSSFGDECEMKLVIAASSSPRARAA